MTGLFIVRPLRVLVALTAAALVTMSCAVMDPKSSAQANADRALADQVRQALDNDASFFFGHVQVQAENGKVSLSGYVWSDAGIERAQTVAKQVPGVTTVVDRLELERANQAR